MGIRLKRWVVRHVSYQRSGLSSPCAFSLGEIIVGNCFPRVPSCSYRALRTLVSHVIEALKGKWGNRRTVEKIMGTLLGVGQECGE